VAVPLPEELRIVRPPVPLICPLMFEVAVAGSASVSVLLPKSTELGGNVLVFSPFSVTPEVAPLMFSVLEEFDKLPRVTTVSESRAFPVRYKVFVLGTVKVPLQALGALRVKLPEPVQVNAPVAVFVPESVKLPEPSMAIAPAP
jgi:hypothetical protein